MKMTDAGKRTVTVRHFGRASETASPEEMAAMSGRLFPLADRVPEAEGEAFDWAEWYDAWRLHAGLAEAERPTHLKVEAADAFEAVIPWEQLAGAAVLVRVNGMPLTKAAPVRLYVPNGTSACLNVKSVVAFHMLHEPERGSDADYGFKQIFSPEELRKR